MLIEGVYLDGLTSKRVPARLEGDFDSGHSVNIYLDDDSNQIINVSFSDLVIESRLGNVPREINFSDNQLFITDNNDAVDALIKSHNSLAGSVWLHRLESSLPLVFIAVFVTIILSWLIVSVGIPKAAKFAAFQLPDTTIEYFGSTLSVLDKTMFSPSQLDIERQQHVQSLAQPYLKKYKQLNPKLIFRASDSPNAFALPDGHIVFTDDIVTLLKSDEEILAILFHELGHLHYKHLLRRALQDSMVTLLVVMVVGDLESADLIAGIPTLLLDLRYSKDFEREADKFAMEELYQNNLDVNYFSSVMQRLSKSHEILSEKNKLETDADLSVEVVEVEQELDTKESMKTVLDFLSTHPASQERIDMVAKFKKEKGLK